MTDRVPTLETLTASARKLGCTAISAEHIFESRPATHNTTGINSEQAQRTRGRHSKRQLTMLAERTAVKEQGEMDQASFSAEHGVFAGAGFFQDLALARLASDAVVVTAQSTASLLLSSQMAVRRWRVDIEEHSGRSHRPMTLCVMSREEGTCECSSKLLSQI